MDAPEEPGTQVAEVTVDPVSAPYAVREALLGGATSPPRCVPAAPLRGRRLRVETRDRAGLYLRARRPRGPLRDLALDATLRAAAARRRASALRETDPPTAAPSVGPGALAAAPDGRGAPPALLAEDLREKVRVRRAGASLIFIVDASGSMRRNRRMVETKTAVLSLLMSAYTCRDRVALVAFRGAGAEVVLPFTASVERARQQLERLPAGGRTPLAEGLAQGLRLAVEERRRHPESAPLLVVISDGKPNWGRLGRPVAEAEQAAWHVRRARVPLLFLDTDPTWHEPGMGQTICRITRGRYLGLAELSAAAILQAVSLRDALPGYRRS